MAGTGILGIRGRPEDVEVEELRKLTGRVSKDWVGGGGGGDFSLARGSVEQVAETDLGAGVGFRYDGIL